MPAVELPLSHERCLRQTCVNDSYVVSTISISKLGQELDALIASLTELVGDIGRADLGIPGGYETMVFAGDNDGNITDWGGLDFCRYDTEDAARKGHEEMVAKWLEMPLGLGT